MRSLILTVLFLFVAGFAYAADIDGTWNGEVPGMGGGEPMKISYTFKADGNTLTGTTKNPMDGSDMVIKDGKIDGSKFSYSIEMMGMPMKFNGEIKGDTVELMMDMSGMPAGPGGGQGGEMPKPQPTILKKAK